MSRPLRTLGLALLLVLATTALAAPAGAAAPAALAGAAASASTVTGRVTTHAGAPVEWAQVTLFTADTFDFIDSATTDTDGRFTVSGVPAGTIKVQFYANGLEQWATDKPDFDSATVFTVVDGQTLTVNESLLPTGTVAGRLTDSAGQAVVGAQVTATDLEGDAWVDGYTDDEGRYSINVLPDEYRVRFQIDGVTQWAYQARNQESAATFTVAVGQTVQVDDALLPTGSLGGRLVNAAGEPVAGATVALHQDGHSAGIAGTDDNGEFQLARVLPGIYQVSFSLGNGLEQWAYGKRSEAEADAITVAVGEHTVVNERLLATGSVAGRFTDQNGNGLPNYSVNVTSATEGDPNSYYTETDADGNYRIDGILVGQHLVSFTDPNTNRSQFAYGKGNAADADRITVSAGETTTVNDSRVPAAKVRVKATDAKTGAAVSGFCVSLIGPSDGGGCTDGTEVVIGNLAAGRYEVGVLPKEGSLYLRGQTHVTTTAGRTTAVSVPLTLGGAIRLTVTDRATGKPLADACVDPVAPGTGGLADGVGDCTDASGKLQTTALASGTYNLFVMAPERSALGHQWVGASGGTGDQALAAKVTVKAGKVAKAPAVRLDRAGTITGTVTRASDGSRLLDANVAYSAWDFGTGPSHGTDVDENGRYTLGRLGPYEWPLVFTASGVPRQWSGGKANRLEAHKIKVKA
ncbi:MAG TPA: carboxypeptidase-like regulatory domain-containing protein, partial [Pilimelia sp.]|nr:carboxypeptidase-like regulatory domain-containing protein [Pilimelia sp.]